MSLLLLREALVLAGSGLGAFTDLKTGLIPDKITYPMIAAGIIFNLLEFDLTSFLIAAIVFAIGYLLYFAGKLGGGDVKLFTGIALVLPFFNGFTFILSVLFAAAIIAVLFLSSYYVIKYIRIGIDWGENKNGIIRSGLLAVPIAIYFAFLLQTGFVSVDYVIILGVPLLFALVFLAFEMGIRKNFFLKKVKLSELDEDDLIAYAFLEPALKEKIKLGFKGIIDEKLKRELEQMQVKEIRVYRDLPKFAPFVFIAVIAVLAYPDLLGVLLLR